MGRLGLVRSGVFFPAFFLVTFVAGIHLKAIGRHDLAVVLWLPVNGFAAFIAVQEISWDAWELVFERLESDDPSDDGPERTLHPDVTVSTNFKVATMVVVSLFATGALGYAAWTYGDLGAYFRGTIPGIVEWYRTAVLPHWESLGLPWAGTGSE